MNPSEITVLYEDDNMLAINKPAGLVVHGDGRTTEPTVVDYVLKHYPEAREVGEHITQTNGDIILRPGIVHRLDRDTSGVLLIAKTDNGFAHLKMQFQNRLTEKTYLACVYGIIAHQEGEIDRPIARSRKDFRLWSAQRGGRGEARDAITIYKVLGRYEEIKGEEATLIEVNPKTGRTHQIRVHMKAVNHPVVADPLYAPKRDPILGFKRLALHAKSIGFETIEGKQVTVEAPLPADFEFALSKFL